MEKQRITSQLTSIENEKTEKDGELKKMKSSLQNAKKEDYRMSTVAQTVVIVETVDRSTWR
jgi:hypothetical protein